MSVLTDDIINKPINRKNITQDIPALCDSKVEVNMANIQGPKKDVILPDNE